MKTVKELGIDSALAVALFLIEEVKELKARLAMELDLVRDRRVAQDREFREFMDQLWATLTDIQAKFRMDATILGLIQGPNAGEEGNAGEREQTNADTAPARPRILGGYVSY